MTNQQVEEKVVWVVLGQEYDGLSRPVANKTVLEVAEEINTAIENGYEILTLGNNDIEVDKVWSVVDYDTNKRIVIDEDNAIPTINERIPTMTSRELFNTFRDTFEWIEATEDDKELEGLIKMQNELLDKIEERYIALFTVVSRLNDK